MIVMSCRAGPEVKWPINFKVSITKMFDNPPMQHSNTFYDIKDNNMVAVIVNIALD